MEGFQGGIVKNGKYIQGYGYGRVVKIQQVDLMLGKTVTSVDLAEVVDAITHEPEAAFVWDDHLYFYTVYGKVYKLYFD